MIEIERPRPEDPATPAEFTQALRALKAWSGLSYREIESRARTAGLRLPFSTASGMLGRTTLPREDLLIAFTTACGLPKDEVAAWVTARKRLAITATTPAPITPPPVAPRKRPKLRHRLALAACAALVAAAALVSQPQLTHDVDVTTDVAVQSTR
ncbi:helix-turn-helix domain-containing protein [Spirillospora sp. CA-294931]|uniref:helix-turn-helix domain-containing protein n=1 Tax=Spirillospora sp. CA-294931 TaxID=3240042 RepID=UPI003D929797